MAFPEYSPAASAATRLLTCRFIPASCGYGATSVTVTDGYQAATIPALMAAPTWWGLADEEAPARRRHLHSMLSKIGITSKVPQALVLVPTRELAPQVAERSAATVPICRNSTCCRSTADRRMPCNWPD